MERYRYGYAQWRRRSRRRHLMRLPRHPDGPSMRTLGHPFGGRSRALRIVACVLVVAATVAAAALGITSAEGWRTTELIREPTADGRSASPAPGHSERTEAPQAAGDSRRGGVEPTAGGNLLASPAATKTVEPHQATVTADVSGQAPVEPVAAPPAVEQPVAAQAPPQSPPPGASAPAPEPAPQPTPAPEPQPPPSSAPVAEGGESAAPGNAEQQTGGRCGPFDVAC